MSMSQCPSEQTRTAFQRFTSNVADGVGDVNARSHKPWSAGVKHGVPTTMDGLSA
jgi:hypothetical protein